MHIKILGYKPESGLVGGNQNWEQEVCERRFYERAAFFVFPLFLLYFTYSFLLISFFCSLGEGGG